MPPSPTPMPSAGMRKHTMNVKLGGLCSISSSIASHARVLPLIGHVDVIQCQVPVAISNVVVIGQSLAHLVPRDRGRRVAKQHDAHQCDVTSFEYLDAGAGVRDQRLYCNNHNKEIVDSRLRPQWCFHLANVSEMEEMLDCKLDALIPSFSWEQKRFSCQHKSARIT